MEDLHLLKDLINQANDAIFIVSPETGYLLDFNDTAHKILGYTRKELLNMRVPDICLSVTDNSSFDIKVKEARGKGYLFFEGEQKRKDGSTFTVELNVRYISNRKNDYLIVIARDITRRKMAEEALKESEKRYEDLYDNAPDMFVSVDVKTAKILRCNQTVATALGYSKKEIIGRPIFEMYHPDCMENVKKAFKSFVETGEVHNAELQLKRKDGSKIEVCLNVAAVRDEQGNVLYSRSILRDITERQKALETLKKSSFYLDSVNDTMIVLNAKREIIKVNKEFSNLWGYSSEEILGKPVFKIFPEEEVPKHLSEMKKGISTKKPLYFETVALAKSGEKVPLSIRGSAIFDKDGKLEGFIGILRDITERKQAEETLKESEQRQRMQAEELSESNTALKVLLKQRENDRREFEENILSNIKHLILPYIEKLKKNRSMSEELAYLNILESNLKEIISPFSTKLSSHYLGFTPKEIQITDLIKDGRQDKEIAEILNISLDTVKFHRKNIRKKFGIYNKRTNLRTLILSRIK
jgi:PAS domain S-box-containing protein